jgi:hypothetical protein
VTRVVLRWLAAAVSAGVLTVFAVLLVTGHYLDEGPVVLVVTASHGVHEGDLYVLAGWALGMIALLCCALTASPRRGPGDSFEPRGVGDQQTGP